MFEVWTFSKCPQATSNSLTQNFFRVVLNELTEIPKQTLEIKQTEKTTGALN